MEILKTIVMSMNILLIIAILSFTVEFTWKKDKASIIGFGYMIIAIGMSSVLMWV